LRIFANTHRCAMSTPPSTFALCAPWKAVPASPVQIRASQLSFRLEALEAAQEVTNELKHFEKRPSWGPARRTGSNASEH
jgi:hypothetical protein